MPVPEGPEITIGRCFCVAVQAVNYGLCAMREGQLCESAHRMEPLGGGKSQRNDEEPDFGRAMERRSLEGAAMA